MKLNYSDQEVIKREKAIFLAVPTLRDKNTISWRKEACEIINKIGFDGVLYIPEYPNWKSKTNYIDQVI